MDISVPLIILFFWTIFGVIGLVVSDYEPKNTKELLFVILLVGPMAWILIGITLFFGFILKKLKWFKGEENEGEHDSK